MECYTVTWVNEKHKAAPIGHDMERTLRHSIKQRRKR